MNFNKEAILAQLNAIVPNTLLETLKISYTDVGDDFLTAKMPVNPSVHQPQGLLHGGATVALAETVGSTASHLFIDASKYKVKGLEISANHLKSKKEGEVFATARFIHKGRTTHLWEIRVVDEEGNLISLCKLTTIVLAK
ncbi:MAG: hotdog fold thioesterase [Kordia sp.]|uniref:hotdog fold thioesterase n=1 Tax=Kordia sp. TaxID=1965332 RepID=UPI00385E6EB1